MNRAVDKSKITILQSQRVHIRLSDGMFLVMAISIVCIT
jgi:hypothetical protein